MLKTVDLIEKIGKEYEGMLKTVNVPDFYKCIAQYSGIAINHLNDDMIVEYLGHWAKNKKHIFDFLGGVTQVDMDIEFTDENRDYHNKLHEMARKYPAYYGWLTRLTGATKNEVNRNFLDYSMIDTIIECFPDYKFDGESITHFFKNKLDAPDSLVTALGRLYENVTIKANFTISIDPVDIMLSSENPYNWQSCYRLSLNNEESHADGCLAGVIDSATLVTYIWTEEGKFDLYNTYKFKNIRYKRMRMTIATNAKFNAIHFNEIYPGKCELSDEFHKLLRDKVETFFAKQLNKENVWVKNGNGPTYQHIRCCRGHNEYGYSEYDDSDVYLLKGENAYIDIIPYDTTIHCPCGCGCDYPGTYDPDDEWYRYNGMGHTNENWEEEEEEGTWCEETDEYEDCDGDCERCSLWNRNHAVCEITEEPCDDYNIYDLEMADMIDVDMENTIHCEESMCKNCPHYHEPFGHAIETEETE